jgi:diguanylate cyclase (GGDEF)-like protein/PAS domain S-box-containing protein
MTVQPSELQPTPKSRQSSARRAFVRWMQETRAHASISSLRTSVAILSAQQEATLDGILVVDHAGRILSYNRRFLEIWNVPPDVAASADDNELLGYAAERVVNWDQFIETVEYLYNHPEDVRKDDTVLLKDGRTLSRASVPVITRGKVVGRAWYFRDVTDAERARNLQNGLFRIAQLTREAEDLDDFYQAIHDVVGTLMDATNFYIAEYDAERDIMRFPYFVDEMDPKPEGQPPGRGLTAYVLRTGKPLFANPQVFRELEAADEITQMGAECIDWIGAPLKTGDRVWGVIGVQSYHESKRFRPGDGDILVFVAQHVASAIEYRRKEDALRESERRYRQMFENNRAVQLLIDPDSGTIVDANMAAADFYGYALDELIGMRIWQINVLGPERVLDEMAKTTTQERNYFVFRHMLANGELRDVEVHSGPVVIGGRTVLYSIIHDITERKQAERALLESEEKFRNIFNYASIGIYQSTLEGRLLTANETLAQMLGYDSPAELLQRNLVDIYLEPSDRDDLVGRIAPIGYGSDFELRWRKKDGTPIWIRMSAHAIHSRAGEMMFEGFVYDVTERKIAEEKVAAANAQRKAVLDAATRVAIIATDPQGVVTMFNTGAERLLEYSAAEMVGERSVIDLHRTRELAHHAERLAMTLDRPFDVLVVRAAAEGLEEREWTWVRKDGKEITVLLSVTALRDEEGAITGFLHVATDVTERKAAEAMLRKQSAAITASMDGIGILDAELDFTYANDALAKLFGFAVPQALLGKSLQDLYSETENDRFRQAILPAVFEHGRWRGETTGVRRDGSTFPQEISLTALDGGGIVIVVRDVSERTYAEEQIKHLAYHDALTGLPNRLLFKDRLTVALSHAQRNGSRLAVLFLDLDRFKVINDSLGHNIGDQLLQALAARVQSCVRESDTVARLGGDEMTLLLPNLNRSEDAAPVAQKILEAVRYPFHIEGREFYITTSIGISLYPEDGLDAETLIKNADTAMYQAKEQGRDNYQLFNAYINARALQRIALEHGLRRALANDELMVHYQPIFDLRTERISGMEALLRWNHPEMGPIPPGMFIPLAEANGLMVPIGTWAMRAACMQARKWHEAGFRNLSLAVNLSVCQLQQPDLVQRVREILQETNIHPRMLELEITESSAMQSPETSVRTLYELKKLGVRISLDDFGTGHSSLSYLKRFPIDTLKIDQSFVRDIVTDPDTASIVSAIIAMARSLRLKVIAEGVEFTEQADFLRRYNCDQMQGYLIKPPVPAGEFEELIASLV